MVVVGMVSLLLFRLPKAVLWEWWNTTKSIFKIWQHLMKGIAKITKWIWFPWCFFLVKPIAIVLFYRLVKKPFWYLNVLHMLKILFVVFHHSRNILWHARFNNSQFFEKILFSQSKASLEIDPTFVDKEDRTTTYCYICYINNKMVSTRILFFYQCFFLWKNSD